MLKPLRNIWLFHFAWRIFSASRNFNKKYAQIIVWGIQSREDTNHTYDLTDSNILYLAHTIAIITKKIIRKFCPTSTKPETTTNSRTMLFKKPKILNIENLRICDVNSGEGLADMQSFVLQNQKW